MANTQLVSKQAIGKVAITPKGEYSGSVQYQPLDLVTNGSASYLAKKESKNKAPSENPAYWQLVAMGGASTPALDSRGYLYWPEE